MPQPSARAETVGRRVERLAATVRRQHPRVRQRDVEIRRENQVDAAGQRHVAVAGAQAPDRPDARRPATTSTRCRASGWAPAGRAGTTAGPRRCCARCRTRNARRASRVGGLELQVGVVAAGHADVDTGRATAARRSGAWPACSSASHATSSNSRCCGSMPCASRGEIPKNAGSNRSIEAQEAALARRDPSWRVRIRIVQRIDVPPIGRHAARSRRRRRAAAARTYPDRRRRPERGSPAQ